MYKLHKLKQLLQLSVHPNYTLNDSEVDELYGLEYDSQIKISRFVVTLKSLQLTNAYVGWKEHHHITCEIWKEIAVFLKLGQM
jgi:hypothetical protein